MAGELLTHLANVSNCALTRTDELKQSVDTLSQKEEACIQKSLSEIRQCSNSQSAVMESTRKMAAEMQKAVDDVAEKFRGASQLLERLSLLVHTTDRVHEEQKTQQAAMEQLIHDTKQLNEVTKGMQQAQREFVQIEGDADARKIGEFSGGSTLQPLLRAGPGRTTSTPPPKNKPSLESNIVVPRTNDTSSSYSSILRSPPPEEDDCGDSLGSALSSGMTITDGLSSAVHMTSSVNSANPAGDSQLVEPILLQFSQII